MSSARRCSSDSATISGGYNGYGGSITFTLTAPNNTTTTVGTVPVSGNGTYSRSDGDRHASRHLRLARQLQRRRSQQRRDR